MSTDCADRCILFSEWRRNSLPLHCHKDYLSLTLTELYRNIAFTGDVYINMHGMTAQQAEYNQYAPILMTSVDTDPKLCNEERTAIIQRLGVGNWKIFGAHGAPKNYCVK